MSQPALLLILAILLFSGILAGLPVAFVLLGVPMLVAVLGALTGGFDMAFIDAFPARAFAVFTNPVFLAIPLFVLMGALLEKSDIARRMMLTAGALFGDSRGGLAYAVVIVGALLAASTGVIAATIFMLGMIGLPAMLSANYSPKLAAGVICASGSLGQIIPPSILLILLADQVSAAHQTGRRMAGGFAADPVTVGDLFAGALLPGLLLVGFYLAYVFMISIIRPQSCPPVRRFGESGETNRPDWREVIQALIAPLALILLVLGSILGGIATPTESAALGAAGALVMVALGRKDTPDWQRLACFAVIPAAAILVVVRLAGGANEGGILMAVSAIALIVFLGGIMTALWREILFGVFIEAARATALTVSMLMMIVLGATMLSLVFRGLGGDAMVTEFLDSLPGGVMTALFAVMAVIFVLGFILEFVEIIYIVIPVAGPPLLAAGVDPVWFAILVSMNLQMSFLTPPFGYALFYFRAVAPASLTTREVYASIAPFIIIQLTALSLLAVFPWLATWLPKVIYQ